MHSEWYIAGAILFVETLAAKPCNQKQEQSIGKTYQ